MTTPGPIVHIVACSLKETGYRQRFLELTRDLALWLADQPGFLRYERFETEDGFVDTLLWADQASLDAGDAAFRNTRFWPKFLEIVAPEHRAFRGSRADIP